MDMITLAMAKKYADSQRLGYVTEVTVMLDADTEIDDDMGGSFVGIEPADENMLEAGKSYTVTTDSGTYTAVCSALGDSSFVVGNAKVFGLVDTGESFGVFLFYESSNWVFLCLDYNGGSHMRVAEVGAVHTIDPKYLPGAEIIDMTEATSVEIPLAFAEEIKANALAGKTPCAIKAALTTGGDPIIAVPNASQVGDGTVKLYAAFLNLFLTVTITWGDTSATVAIVSGASE